MIVPSRWPILNLCKMTFSDVRPVMHSCAVILAALYNAFLSVEKVSNDSKEGEESKG